MATRTESTPGPWTILPHDHADKRIEIQEPAVFVDYDDVDYKEQDANARLIAAAPDLVAALKLYVALDNDRRAGAEITDNDWAVCYQDAAAALAKAGAD